MTNELREQFRLSILQLFNAAGASGIRSSYLSKGLAADGFSVTADQIAAEIAYLADKSFACEVSKSISPELKRWRITAAGRDFLAAEGLAWRSSRKTFPDSAGATVLGQPAAGFLG